MHPTHCVVCAARFGQYVIAAAGADACLTHRNDPDYVLRGGGRRETTLATAPTTAMALVTGTDWNGQVGLKLPGIPRQARPVDPAWNRRPCAACARAGVHRYGEPRSGSGSEPLCVPCWRGGRDREVADAIRAAEAAYWDSVGELDTDLCPACGASEPTPECWLCSFTYLDRARREFEAEQAAVKAAQDAAIAAEFERISTITESETDIAGLERVLEHARSVVDAYLVGRGWGRPIVLLADLMARDAAARTTLRGRPNEALARVGAVMVLDCDPRSGRRSLPGRAMAARLAGVDKRTVTAAWKRMEQLGWLTRTEQGRRLSMVERVATGRCQARAAFDIAPVHRSPVDRDLRAASEPLALATVGDLIQTILSLVSAAYVALDGLRGRSGADVDWPERARRAQMRQTAGRVATAAQDIDRNFFPPRMASSCEYLSSCSYWGIEPSRTHALLVGGRPDGRRGERASRSSTRSNRADLDGPRSNVALRKRRSHPVQRPRTLQATRPEPRKRVQRPDWADWAADLARDLRRLWPQLSSSPSKMIAAVLGRNTGPDWTATGLAAWIMKQRSGRPLPDTIHSGAGWLKNELTQAFSGLEEPPFPARLAAELRRETVADQASELREQQASARAEAERRRDDTQLSAAGVSARDQARAIANRSGSGTTTEVKSPAVVRPRREKPAEQPGSPRSAAAVDQCEVSWHGCSGEVAAYSEPWDGGRERHYCAACATAVTAAW
ncbi:hypothetical protein AB0M47_21140 [Hamadaea sp. NPDC051192]|uniref:hypothetical protein n=1 Tax=Hamadaea sp. NPDC051192 TaxID=3154940 RepID=UPI00342D15BF